MPLHGKQRLLKTYRSRADQLVSALALETTRRVVLRTSVLTGRARGNWNLNVGAPDTSVDESSTDKSGAGSIGRAVSKVAQIRAGNSLFVTNSLPYIESLEKGSSKQAPQGMIAVTVRELQPLVNQIVNKIRRGK